MWVSTVCTNNTKMGTMGRSRSDGEMKDSALNTSRGRRPRAAQRAEAAGAPDRKVQEVGQPVQLDIVCPALRMCQDVRDLRCGSQI